MMMEINELKKFLYKSNPLAELIKISGGVAYYTTRIEIEGKYSFSQGFSVPISDMGTANFYGKMDSKHLIRWISTE